MLARIAHELFWLGRNVARAEHTARMLDGVFQADLQGAPDDPRRGAPRLGRRSWRSWARAPDGAAVRRDEVAAPLTLDPRASPRRDRASSRAREGARTVRDVISADMWEAINTTHLGAARPDARRAPAGGPVRGLPVRQGAQRAVLGPDRPDDAARRGERVPRRRRPDRVGRHGAADAARRAAADERRRRRRATARRSRCCRPSAASRPTAAPSRRRRTRARSRASCSTSARTPTASRRRSTASTRRSTTPTPSPRNSEPVLRLSRLGADLEFRGRADARRRPARDLRARPAASSRASTATSPSATSRGARPGRWRVT